MVSTIRNVVRSVALAMVLAALSTESAHANRFGDALGALFRTGGEAAGVVACTVVAGPVNAADDSLEADVLCLDTSIQMRVVWLRFSSRDRRAVNRSIALGSTVVVRSSSGLVVDGSSVLQANRWRARRGGNPARSEFLRMDAARLPLLAWALRDDPDVARHFGLNFHDVAAQLPGVIAMLEALGHPVTR